MLLMIWTILARETPSNQEDRYLNFTFDSEQVLRLLLGAHTALECLAMREVKHLHKQDPGRNLEVWRCKMTNFLFPSERVFQENSVEVYRSLLIMQTFHVPSGIKQRPPISTVWNCSDFKGEAAAGNSSTNRASHTCFHLLSMTFCTATVCCSCSASCQENGLHEAEWRETEFVISSAWSEILYRAH